MKILAVTPHSSHDYLTICILEGLKKLGVDLHCTAPGNGAINVLTERGFASHFPTADYVLAFFSKGETPPPSYHLIDRVSGWSKTAYIDGSEWNYTGYRWRTDDQLHPRFLGRARWYFRRECTPEQQAQGMIPLPYAAVDADFARVDCEKDIDVLCAFGQTDTGLRAEAVRAVRELAADGYRVITSPISDYLKYISRSWITIEAHGAGECNARAWQIMANKSAMFAQEYSIVIPNLDEGFHYTGWSSGDELQAKIREGLANKDGLREMISAAYINLGWHHTSEARARYLIEHLREH